MVVNVYNNTEWAEYYWLTIQTVQTNSFFFKVGSASWFGPQPTPPPLLYFANGKTLLTLSKLSGLTGKAFTSP